MPKLTEQITALETRLRQLKARQQRVEARRRSIEAQRIRKTDTRRKVLIGAIVMARIEQGRFPEAELRAWLKEGLTRDDDRALFELPAIQSESCPDPSSRRS